MSFPNQDFHVCRQVLWPAWAQKKELADMNSISQHTNPDRSHRRMQQDRGWLAKTQLLYNSFAATEIWDPGPGRAGPAGLLPGTGFIFRGYMPYLSNSAQKRSPNQPDSLRGGRMGGPGG